MATGLGALGGPLHGGASLGAEAMLAAAAGPRDAAGVVGGYAASSRAVCDLLINRARSLVFATALPPAVACAALAALAILRGPEGDDRRRRLFANINQFTIGLRALGLPAEGRSAIVPVVLGTPERALAISAGLRQHGFVIQHRNLGHARHDTLAAGS